MRWKSAKRKVSLVLKTQISGGWGKFGGFVGFLGHPLAPNDHHACNPKARQ